MRFLDLTPPSARRAPRGTGAGTEAFEPYLELLRSGDPDRLESAHVEALAALRPLQRRRVRAALTRAARPADRPWSDDADELALGVLAVERRQQGAAASALRDAGVLRSVAESVTGARSATSEAAATFAS